MSAENNTALLHKNIRLSLEWSPGTRRDRQGVWIQQRRSVRKPMLAQHVPLTRCATSLPQTPPVSYSHAILTHYENVVNQRLSSTYVPALWYTWHPWVMKAGTPTTPGRGNWDQKRCLVQKLSRKALDSGLQSLHSSLRLNKRGTSERSVSCENAFGIACISLGTGTKMNVCEIWKV